MNVWTTRSGRVLHGSSRCPDLMRKRLFVIVEEDAVAGAVRCTHGSCAAVFARAAAREAKAA